MGIVLGLHGKVKSGKDATADYLIENHGWDTKLAFARNLKDMCKRIFVLSEYEVSEQEGKEKEFPVPLELTHGHLGSILFWMSLTHSDYPIAPSTKEAVKGLVGKKLTSSRHVLQFVGTDVCRLLVPTYHADVLAIKIKELGDVKVIITDVRFPDEAAAILDQWDGMVTKIVRPGEVACDSTAKHLSENALESWERFSDTLYNDVEGLSFLYSKIDEFLERNEI